jgi:hypothetical protein
VYYEANSLSRPVTLGRSQNELAEKYINEDRCFPLGFAHVIEAAVIGPVTPRERK